MELYLCLSLVIVADAVILRFIPKRRPVARFVCISILFAIETALIVALVAVTSSLPVGRFTANVLDSGSDLLLVGAGGA
jgi:hypothetical protein